MFILWAGKKGLLAKKHYLTAYRGGVGEGREGNMKKYKILWGNTPKFRSFVVVTAILLNMRGRGGAF